MIFIPYFYGMEIKEIKDDTVILTNEIDAAIDAFKAKYNNTVDVRIIPLSNAKNYNWVKGKYLAYGLVINRTAFEGDQATNDTANTRH